MKNKMNVESSYDAVVVGGRVAGASTAMLLARAGLRVLVVDKSSYGADTTSTHALMRAGVMQLRRWGVLKRLVADGTPAIRKTTFHYEDETIPVDIKEHDGVDALYAPRRTVLDAALVDAAREAGAQVEFGALFQDVFRDDSGRVAGILVTDAAGVSHRVRARIVVGADGRRSRVARAVVAETVYDRGEPGAVIYGYRRGLDLDGTHWYFGRDVAAGVIPTNDGLACLFASMRASRFDDKGDIGLDRLFMDVLADNDPELERAAGRSEAVGKLHLFAGSAGFLRRAWGPGWALVGDAGCFKDPITAHGMTDALRDAELLAGAIIDGSDDAFAAYQSTRDEIGAEFVGLSGRIGSFDWDAGQVKTMHHRLSKLMNRECELVRSFEDSTSLTGSTVPC